MIEKDGSTHSIVFPVQCSPLHRYISLEKDCCIYHIKMATISIIGEGLLYLSYMQNVVVICHMERLSKSVISKGYICLSKEGIYICHTKRLSIYVIEKGFLYLSLEKVIYICHRKRILYLS